MSIGSNKKHGVVRTDRLSGTDNRKDMRSVMYYVDGEPADIDNGCVVYMGKLIDGEREVYAVSDIPTEVDGAGLVLIATPELTYDPRLRSLSDFYNEAGRISRGYLLNIGDSFGVTRDCLVTESDADPEADPTDPAVGDLALKIVSLKDGKIAIMHPGDLTPRDSSVIGTIVAIEKAGANTFYVIEVGGQFYSNPLA